MGTTDRRTNNVPRLRGGSVYPPFNFTVICQLCGRFTFHVKENTMRNQGCRQGAFTLVELLVVISIISILAGMLLPALERAREQANTITCLNNLKSVSTAAIMYHSDFQIERVPGLGYGVGYWQSLLAKHYLGYENGWAGQPVQGVFKCPSEYRNQPDDADADWSDWRGSHYGMNYYLVHHPDNTDGRNYQRWHPNYTLSEPSEIMYLMEKPPGIMSCEVLYDNPRNELPTYFRHNEKANALFLDGHAISGDISVIPTELVGGLNSLGRYRFWHQRSISPNYLDL
jgi:prepilin-type N-terminal cleavage/methylation domain-containing protein/prepilin-type processing-associated H-X9-DG protein